MTAWVGAAVGIASLVYGIYDSEKKARAAKKGVRTDYNPISSFLPSGFHYLGGTGQTAYGPESKEMWDLAAYELVRGAAEGLDQGYVERSLANYGAAFDRAQDEGAAYASSGYGPVAQTPYLMKLSKARGLADLGSQLRYTSDMIKDQRMNSILSFYSQAQNRQFGVPSQVTYPYGGSDAAAQLAGGVGAIMEGMGAMGYGRPNNSGTQPAGYTGGQMNQWSDAVARGAFLW